MSTESSDRPPFSIPGYDLGKMIGEGGFGRVFEARDNARPELLRAAKIIDPSPFQDHQKALARFEREAKALRSLEHRAIIRYIASGVTEPAPPLPYLITEFIDGEPFRGNLALSDVEMAEKMAEVLDGLAFAHLTGTIHRDIKPSNLMIRTADGQPIILDFGLALFLEDDGVPITTRYVGSMGYVPPEVLSGEEKSSVNHDVFSCAVTLYELFAGKRPDIQKPRPLSSIRSELAPLDEIISRGLAPVGTRFESAAAFASALRGAARRLSTASQLAGSNPIAEHLRRKAIERREQRRKMVMEYEEEESRKKDAWAVWDAMIIPAARKAFSDMLVVAQELDDKYELNDPASRVFGVRPLLRLHTESVPDHFVAFGLSSDISMDPLDVGGSEAALELAPNTGAIGAQLPPAVEVLRPSWIVYAQGGYPLRIMHGALAVAVFDRGAAHRLFARPLDSDRIAEDRRWAIQLNTPREVFEYLTKAVGSALGFLV